MFDLYENLQFSVHGGGNGDGLIGAVNSLLTLMETLIRMSPADIFARLLPGIAAMANLHPLFVHFPIVLLTLFFLIELIAVIAGKPAWRRAADWFLYPGALFAGLTVAAGYIAAASVAHGEDAHEIMEAHQELGVSILLIAATLSVWRLFARSSLLGMANYLYLAIAGLLSLLLVSAADLGGLMVYKFGVGVSAAPAAESPAEHHHDHDHP
ncbi:MAG: DUF2231 domain-containing protein [Methylococcales bacterium]|nr:DUF2231 domain-containing protein [Methylococcales bacterium]